MSCLTKRQKHLRKACKVKVKYQYTKSDINVQVNIDDSESYSDVNDTYFHDKLEGYGDVEDLDIDNTFFYDDDNFSVHDEPVEINNAISIVKKLQEVAKKYHQEYASQEIHRSRYIGNSSHTKRRKNQQQHEAAKGTLKLYTF